MKDKMQINTNNISKMQLIIGSSGKGEKKTIDVLPPDTKFFTEEEILKEYEYMCKYFS